MTKPRLQFSILSMLIAVAVVAAILGIRMYIDPHLYWRDLWVLIFAPAILLTGLWLIFGAPWSARIFAIAFAFGAVAEILAICYSLNNDLVRLTPGVWAPEGWYPLALPIMRLFFHLDWMGDPGKSTPAYFAGMAASGAAFGVLALAVRYCTMALFLRNKIVNSGSQPANPGDHMLGDQTAGANGHPE